MAGRQIQRDLDIQQNPYGWHFAQMPKLALPQDKTAVIED